MRLGKRERAALRIREHEQRAKLFRSIRVGEVEGHYHSVWDNPMPRATGGVNHTGWSKHHKPGKVKTTYIV